MIVKVLWSPPGTALGVAEVTRRAALIKALEELKLALLKDTEQGR